MDSAKKRKGKNHAFALRDFDDKRILQRRFFKDFHFDADKTDEEILQFLQAAEEISIEILEQNQKTIKKTYERLEAYHSLLNRHQTRLSQFNKVKAAKLGVKISELKYGEGATIIEYSTVDLSTIELVDKFKNGYYELEKRIQRQYRLEFAERLKRARRAAGLTQKQLGDMIQISPSVFSRYENAERDIPLHTIVRLAKALEINGDQILGITKKTL